MLSVAKAPKTVMLDCAKIAPNPMQPRKYFDPSEIENLAQSIRTHGLLQPISVRKAGGGFELVAGERRLRAAQMAGLSKIACIVLPSGPVDSEILALVENVQRCDLHFLEEAAAIYSLLEKTGLTQSQLAASLGKSQSALANKLRLLALDAGLRNEILQSDLTERHARALLSLEPERRAAVLRQAISMRLTVPETESLVARLNAVPQTPSQRRVRGVIRDLRLFDNSLNKAVSSLKCCGIMPVVNRKKVSDGVEYTIKISVPE